MSGPILIRPCRASDKHQLLDIVERVYDSGTRKRHEILWDWWFSRHSRSPCPGVCPTVLERNGLVVGYLGLQYRRFKLGTMEATGAFGLDNFVDPHVSGLGITLMRHVLAATSVLLGSPNEASGKVWKMMGRRQATDVFIVRKAKRVIDPAPVLSSRHLQALILPARAAWHLVSSVLARFAPRLPDAVIEDVERFPPETDAFLLRWLSARTNVMVRDSAYLNWRFCEGPVAYRKVILRQKGRVAGLAAFRVGWMNGRRILILTEALAEHPLLEKAYGSILAHVLAHGRRCMAVDIQTLDAGCPGLRQALRRWGFVFRKESMPIIGKMEGDMSRTSSFFRIQDWFISAGDSDLEFTYFNQGWRELEGRPY